MAIERNRSHRTPLSDEEQSMLHAVAEHAGLSAADWIRQQVRKAYAELEPRKRK